jgi:uncharacterized protein HemX
MEPPYKKYPTKTTKTKTKAKAKTKVKVKAAPNMAKPISDNEIRAYVMLGATLVVGVMGILGFRSEPGSLLTAQQTAITNQNELVQLQLKGIQDAIQRVESAQNQNASKTEASLKELRDSWTTLDRKMIDLQAKQEALTIRQTEMAKMLDELKKKGTP